MKEIYLGAAYYPEMWDESEVIKDIERCKSLGINTLRIGEFAWGNMEPKEGEFQFDWLKKIVNQLYQNGIYTIMCTPTSTPPRWLLNKYDETRRIASDLIHVDVSSRCHTCKTSPKMREKNRIIVTEMAKVFAGHPGVIGWQIDNEIYPYDEGCFCEKCKRAFREYLKDIFDTVDNLNKAWGMTRWSLTYESFDDIQPPYPSQWRHPSLRKAWRDFQYRQIISYIDEQADILHSYNCPNVGTNMMAHNSLGYYDVNKKLDVVQYNHYNPAKDLPFTAFAYDFLRCVKDKPFWVIETQVGWNGSEYAENGYRPQGNCYANTWLPIAKGAEMNLYWLFRTHPNGHELAHGALFSSAGRQYKVSDEVKKAGQEFKKCASMLNESFIKSKIAIHYSTTALNIFESAPILKNLNYRETLIHKFYDAFRHYNVDLIDTPHSLDGYDVVISPFLATVDENGLKERIIEWVKNGGTWIVGPMSDIMDSNVSKYTHAPYSFLEDFCGVYTKYQKPIDNNVFRAKWNDGKECSISMCYDAYELLPGTISLATYSNEEFSGLSIITQRKVGKGKVILVGSVIGHKDMLRLVNLEPIAKASKNVILTERSDKQNAIIVVEVENKIGYIQLKQQYKDLITGKTFKGKVKVLPYQVLVLQNV
ncbi:MAG TPA: beta-galactosidase [Clostridia bacterium]